jgi:hypothetical protein
VKKKISGARLLDSRIGRDLPELAADLARQKNDRADFWRQFNLLVARCERLEQRLDAFEADCRRRLDRLEMNHNPKEKTP